MSALLERLKIMGTGIQIGLYLAYAVSVRILPLLELIFAWDVWYLMEVDIRFTVAFILVNIPSAVVWWRIYTTHF